MKKIFFLLSYFLIGMGAKAQHQGTLFRDVLTVQKIYQDPNLRSELAQGFNILSNDSTYAQLDFEEPDLLKLNLYSLRSGAKIKELADLSQFKNFSDYSFSADESKLLIACEAENIYRHSIQAKYYVFNINTQETIEIPGGKIRYATLNRFGNKLAYVRDNNLFIYQIESKKEIPITFDGKINQIINGAVDWVYEEEFSMDKGFEWSNDGIHLAYFRFDESEVKEFSMQQFSSLYPKNITWKYPKAGEANSKVSVFIVNTDTQIPQLVLSSGGDMEYIPRIQFSDDGNYLISQGLNRYQNTWRIHAYKVSEGKGTMVYTENNSRFINLPDKLVFIPNETQLLFTSEKKGNNHIYCLDYEKKRSQQITEGDWQVTTLHGYDNLNQKIYFNATYQSVLEDHLFSINLNGKNFVSLTFNEGNHEIVFSPKFTFYTDVFSTANTPDKMYLRETGTNWERAIFQNEKLNSWLSVYQVQKVSFDTMQLPNGVSLNYWYILPPTFDSTKRYPVLMYCYGGPGHNTVRNDWMGSQYLWHSMMASKGYIIASVDNRGTGYRGEEFAKCTYKQLGNLECEDQIAAAKWLSKLPFVDSTRLGIWGWSFGGYLSSLCISKGAEVFKTAIAVAPVTNWKYYDNIYTERYMGLPQENLEGYDQNSPISHVSKIRGNYLIIHGTGDDNVHFQNTAEMINAMIKEGITFDSEIYPNRSHGIGDKNARIHLYQKMTSYLISHL